MDSTAVITTQEDNLLESWKKLTGNKIENLSEVSKLNCFGCSDLYCYTTDVKDSDMVFLHTYCNSRKQMITRLVGLCSYKSNIDELLNQKPQIWPVHPLQQK